MNNLLTQKQVAEILGVSEGTLENWRVHKRYPLAYIKVGSLVRYKPSDVEAFIQFMRVEDEQDAD